MLQSPNTEFSLSKARNIISDLFQPRPLVYWADFLLSYGLGLYCFQVVYGGTLLVPHQGFTGEFSQIGHFVVSCLLFYRSAMFIHEIVHQRTTGRLGGFRFVWNLLCGIPFLIPSFIYYTHIDHHRRHHFGTEQDGEYIPLAKGPSWYIWFYVSWSFVIPLAGVARFLVLTPLAWCVPGFRGWVHKHASSMVMDPTYIRPLPTKQAMRIVYIQEAACFVWCLAVALYGPMVLGEFPIGFFVHAYLMSVAIILLNSIRTLGSHRWHNEGEEMSFVDQLLDSVNYPGLPLISELWGPVGTRYHALHHLFPSLPYHAMGEAHRRLVRALPADSPYQAVQESSLTSGILRLFRTSGDRQRRVETAVPKTATPDATR